MKQSLRTRVINAGFWTAVTFGGQRVIQLASNLALTRLLFPEAFGLMSLANVFLIGLTLFSDVGIRPAIVQSDRGDDPAFLNTAWTLQVIRGFTLWAGACALAYPASQLYGHAILWPLISVLGATAAIAGFASISVATCERRMLVKRLNLVQLASQTVSLTMTALLAWQLQSIWSLAWGALAGSIVTTAFSHWFLPKHQHRFQWDRSCAQALVRFGRWIFVSTAMTFTAGHGLRMLQGFLLTPSEIGVLSIAQTMAALPTELVSQIASLAIFPALAEARQAGHDRMIEIMRKIQGKIMILAMAAFIGLMVIAIPLIALLYDSRYVAAGPQLMLLALSGAIAVVSLPYQNAVLAMGNSRLSANFNLVTTVTRATLMILGFQLAGINGMLLGIGAGSLLTHLYVVARIRKYELVSIKTDAMCFAAIMISVTICYYIYRCKFS